HVQHLNSFTHYTAYGWDTGPAAPADNAWAQLHRPGRVDWVTDLADIPQQYGVNNVYGDLGQIYAHSTMAEPRVCAFMMGALIKGMGADHVCWGTDSLWTGAPQWQIEALRRLEIPEDIQKKYGFEPLGPANGPVKSAILGGNSARLYGYSPKQQAAVLTDKVAYYKEIYERNGGGRTTPPQRGGNKNKGGVGRDLTGRS